LATVGAHDCFRLLHGLERNLGRSLGAAPDQSGIVLQDVLQETPLGVVTQSMVVIAMSRP
jgi:hypothetical protein